MDSIKTEENIKAFIEAVIPEYNPEKIVLYGSYAKGTNHAESDIDIAVIVNEVRGSFLAEEAKLYKIRRKYDINIEPILLESINDKSGFIEHIMSYGYVLYDSTTQGNGSKSIFHNGTECHPN